MKWNNSESKFLLSSEECELLLAFEASQTIEKTAKNIARDASGVSRQLSRIAAKYPAIEKRSGKWTLTETGRELNSISRDMIQIQKRLVAKRTILRIGMNREFGARIFGVDLPNILSLFPNTKLFVQTFTYGTEEALLDGRIDVGIDCERPHDPEIAYKLIVNEPIFAVCSPSFKKNNINAINKNDLHSLPHLLCNRLFPDKIFMEQENRINVICSFNDIATTKSACVAGVGWALLPNYSIKNELQEKKLVMLDSRKLGNAKYGIWWPRNRFKNDKIIKTLCEWLKQQKL